MALVESILAISGLFEMNYTNINICLLVAQIGQQGQTLPFHLSVASISLLQGPSVSQLFHCWQQAEELFQWTLSENSLAEACQLLSQPEEARQRPQEKLRCPLEQHRLTRFSKDAQPASQHLPRCVWSREVGED